MRQTVGSSLIQHTLSFVYFSETKLGPEESEVEDTNSSFSELVGDKDQRTDVCSWL